ncbi:MAG: zinc-ribbon domain-containing protein [Lachnospiraceae bacterium]|nr:zinc-ribbon domain-containing protein [Lachnospiraceae bacterium]
MFCPNCGTNLGNEAKFCNNCGFKLGQGAGKGPDPGGGQVRQEWLNGNMRREPAKPTGKGGYTALWIVLGLILGLLILGGVAFWLLIGRNMDGSDGKAYGGTKIKKQIIWEKDGIEVSATGLYIDDGMGEMYGGYRMEDGIELSIINGTDKDLIINCVSLAVDGASVQGMLDARLPAGQKGKAILKMDNFSLYNMQLDTLGAVTAELSVKDANTGKELYNPGIICIKTDKDASVPDYRYGDGKGLFDESGVSVSTKGYDEVPGLPLTFAVMYQVKNSSGRSVRLDFEDMKLNGRSFEYKGSAVFQTGTKGMCYVSAPFDDLNAIEKSEGDFFPVSEITGTCNITDANTGELIVSVPYSYKKP